jgi:hypothetical protein
MNNATKKGAIEQHSKRRSKRTCVVIPDDIIITPEKEKTKTNVHII